MKVEEKNVLVKLFDAYGGLLSDGQKEIMQAYINDDFTLSEIAENLNVSRQAVKDSINKAEKKLFEMEEKLGFVKKIDLLNGEIDALKQKVFRLENKKQRLSKKEED